ncbi:hypothetical protein [Steroidobacter sp.]|uniref:hypothetical protein n=1 Tax=Steroidobacter sp. TaxID=1978227 RepID=UPI0025E90120|nr:hypothetical protein [Steroidobacter sp.]
MPIEVIAEQMRLPDRAISIAKAAVNPQSLGNDAALAIQQSGSAGFISFLASFGALAAMSSSTVRIPIGTPIARVSQGGVGAIDSGEISWTPLSRMTIDGESALAPRKLVYIDALTNEFEKFGAQYSGALNSQRARDYALMQDRMAFDVLTDSISPISGPTDAVEVIQALAAAVSVGAGSSLWLWASAETVKQMSLLRNGLDAPLFPDLRFDGGEISAGIKVVPTDAMIAPGSPEARAIMLVNAGGVAYDPGRIESDVSRQAVLQMVDETAPGAQSTVSLFQTNGVATRLTQFFGLKRLRASAVAWVSDVTFGGSP